MKDKISVLMPVYNRERYVKAAIMSILHQTYENFELIIYDDGSNDRTVVLIMALAKQDKRIRYIIGKINHGVGYARNRLLNEVETKYACWQDSDDMSNIYRLEIQLGTLKKVKAPLVFTNYTINHAPNFLKNVIASRAWLLPPGTRGDDKEGFATSMFEVDKVGIFNPDLKLGGEDREWLDEIQGKYGNCPMISEVLYYIRFHEDRIGAQKRKLWHYRENGLEEDLSYRQMVETLR